MTDQYGLDEDDLHDIRLLCDGDENRMRTALHLFNNQRASSSGTNYRSVIKDFKQMCSESEGMSYKKFGLKEVVKFITWAHEAKKGHSYLSYIRPALKTIERIRNVSEDESVFSNEIVNDILKGGKRLANIRAGPVKKMDAVPMEAIRTAIKIHIWDKAQDVRSINLPYFRTIFQWVVMGATLCRFEGYRHLKAKHFSIFTDTTGAKGVRIFFPLEKNDVTHRGKVKMMAQGEPGSIIEPVSLTMLYFERCGFRMADDDDNYILCRTIRKDEADGRYQLGYQTSVNDGKKVLESVGFGHIKYGSSSTKRIGATNAIVNDVDLDTVTHAGGWATREMVTRYTEHSDDFKLKIARNMKFN